MINTERKIKRLAKPHQKTDYGETSKPSEMPHWQIDHARHRIRDPVNCKCVGGTIYAVKIPEGAEGIWNELTRFHGATAFHNYGGVSMNFFPDKNQADQFHIAMEEIMSIPRIHDRLKQTRAEYDEYIKEIDEYIKEGGQIVDQ